MGVQLERTYEYTPIAHDNNLGISACPFIGIGVR